MSQAKLKSTITRENKPLPNFLLKVATVNSASKFHVGKQHSSLHLPFKQNAVFKKQRASKVLKHLQIKIERLLDIRELYVTISQVTKMNNQKET